jgi:3-hydroxyisobutyrate dehydrogenase-like beta-hydroxyacid dehydrogenase
VDAEVDKMELDIGLIGFGEVGKIFTNELRQKTGRWVGAWDLKFSDTAARDAERAHAAANSIEACASVPALCGKANLIISAVTASSTLAVAQEVARSIQPGTLYLDFNSASPGTKQQCAVLIDAAGGHYVEAGVMNSVPPYGIKVPMLFGGPHAQRLADLLRPLGMDVTPVSEKIGVASAIKMCRSVMIKGLEALVIESYTTARAYGVEEHMISTLYETYPGIDWNAQGAYLFSRVVQHGRRRAEEMFEAANTVKETGFEPVMTAATARKQAWVAGLSQAGVFDGLPKDARWQDYADRLLTNRP